MPGVAEQWMKSLLGVTLVLTPETISFGTQIHSKHSMKYRISNQFLNQNCLQMLQDDSIGHDLEDEDYNDVDMKLVKQMIGLKINESNNGEAGDSSDDEGAVAKHPLSSSNKVFDFKYPSSKVSMIRAITS